MTNHNKLKVNTGALQGWNAVTAMLATRLAATVALNMIQHR